MPVKRSNPGTMRQAAKLRKVPTSAEKLLWAYLRGDKLNGVNFTPSGHFVEDNTPLGISLRQAQYRHP